MMKRKQFVKGRLVNNGGFTLIEIIAVLVILVVIAAVVVSRGVSTDTYSLKGTTDVIKIHLRYAQTRAMSTNAVWGINFETTKTYSLFRDGSTANRVILPGQDSNIVTLETNAPSVTSDVIVSFDLFGKPYTTAAAAVADLQAADRTIAVSLGGTENIIITRNTGFIK